MTNKGDKQQVEMQIRGMTCDGCRHHVLQALEALDGVFEVQIPDWRAGQASLVVDGTVEDRALTGAVQAAGYAGAVRVRQDAAPEAAILSMPSAADYDLVVIGTGAGGMAAAIKGAEMDKRVAIVEGGVLGGTCVNIGCVPSKTLIRAAATYHSAGHSRFEGLRLHAESVDWPTLVVQKDTLVGDLRQTKYQDVLAAYPDHITLIQGWAHFAPDATVVLDDGRVLRGRKVVIATGAGPATLPLPGISEVPVLNSTTLMALEHQPKSLIVIGGRAVALELGQMMARLGTAVTILQRSSRILPEHEPEIADALAEALRDEGVAVHTGVTPRALRKTNGVKEVVADVDGEAHIFHAQEILMAVGRRPNVASLDLPAVSVETDARGFIKVNAQMETSHLGIYAVGDVTTGPKLVYVAAHAGGIAAENALANAGRVLDLGVLPDVVFTDPQVARVGLSEAAAQAAGYQVKTSVLPMAYVPRAITARDTAGLIKLVADRDTDRLLGAQILAAEGGEVIQSAAMALHFGATVADLRAMLFPYLTQNEGLKLAAQVFEKDVTQLSCCAG